MYGVWVRAKTHLARMRHNMLLRHSALLLSGTMVAHLLNTLYQMIVSRALPPSEYALLAAFLGVILILHHPLATLTSGLSRYCSLLCQAGRTGDVKRLTLKWVYLVGASSLLLALLGWILRDPLTEMLHLERVEPVVAAALALPPLFLLPVLLGVSQGIQRFDLNIGATILGSAARVALGAALVWLIHPTSGWALLGHGGGAGISVLLLFATLWFVLRKAPPSRLPLPRLRYFLLQTFLIQLSYAILMTADVVLVKHFLPDNTDFAYAATLGRLAVFLPSAILIAMFPKVTSEGRGTPMQTSIFLQALGYTAVCAVAAVTACALFPRLLLRILFGMPDPSRSVQLMMIAMASIMGMSALLNTCLQFLIAQHRFKPAFIVLFMAAGYLAASWLFHTTIWHIMAWAALFNTLPFFALLLSCWKHAPSPTR